MGEVARDFIATWRGTLSSASSRDYGILSFADARKSRFPESRAQRALGKVPLQVARRLATNLAASPGAERHPLQSGEGQGKADIIVRRGVREDRKGGRSGAPAVSTQSLICSSTSSVWHSMAPLKISPVSGSNGGALPRFQSNYPIPARSRSLSCCSLRSPRTAQ
jgi:hypothetical protein